MPVLLVRHAHALSRSTWEGDDRLRRLSDRGRLQSEALVGVLGEYKPKRILSSPYVRCVGTVAPLASALGLDVEPCEPLAEGFTEAACQLVRQVCDVDTVLCSHGDVIPGVLGYLSDRDGVELGKGPRNEKASVWVLQARKGRFVRARYLKPPRVP